MLLQLRPEFRAEQRQIDLLEHLLQLRACLVGEFVLLVVKFIARVDAVADVGNGQVGFDLAAQRLKFVIGADLRLCAAGRFDLCTDLLTAGANGAEVRTGVLEL